MKTKIDSLAKLEEILGLCFKDKDFLTKALIHRSYLNEAKTSGLTSNERLEFLGDAILSFWVSKEVYNKFPDYPEGKLTFVRTHLVRTETLTKLADKLKLGEYLLMSKGEEQGGGRTNPALLANAFEAVTGAIFLDQGFAGVEHFLSQNFDPLLAAITDAEQLKDCKSRLQELVQAEGHQSPVYSLIATSGPDHQRIFTMAVFLEGKLLAKGASKSKQEAEEAAAASGLEILSQIK